MPVHTGKGNKIKLIYNPVAGDATFRTKLDLVVKKFQDQGWQVIPYRTHGSADLQLALADVNQQDYHALLASGGDGTIHQVVNAMMNKGLELPLGLFPAGTANDLATHLGITRAVDMGCDDILQGYTRKIDLGWLNGTYFINIASAGLLTDVSHKVEASLKNVYGKIAYYLKGLESLPQFEPFRAKIQLEDVFIDQEIMLFMILNGGAAGGFKDMAPLASLEDGKLDLLVVKSCNLPELMAIFLRLLQGQHLKNPHILYYQAQKISIEAPRSLVTDLDGELGPAFPLEIKVIPKALEVFVPKVKGED